MARMGLTEVGNTPYSVAILRRTTTDSICCTSRGHCWGQRPQVEQSQISSLSISVMPKKAWRTTLRMLTPRTRFQGQRVSHRPHWKQRLKYSPPLSRMSSMISW